MPPVEAIAAMTKASTCRHHLLEDYLCSKVVIHVHASLRARVGQDNLRQYCSMQYRPALMEHFDGFKPCALCALDLWSKIKHSDEGGREHLMFIPIVEFVESPQGLAQGIASVVRLQSLDDCLRGWRDAPDLLRSPASVSIFSYVLEDGEPRSAHEVVGEVVGELGNQVVERTPEVMDGVSQEQGGVVGDRPSDVRHDLQLQSIPISLELGIKSIRGVIDHGGDFVVERFQMLLRAVLPLT